MMVLAGLMAVVCGLGPTGCREQVGSDGRPPQAVAGPGVEIGDVGTDTASGSSNDGGVVPLPDQSVDVDVVVAAGGRIHVTPGACVGVGDGFWIEILLAQGPSPDDFLAHLVIDPPPPKPVFVSNTVRGSGGNGRLYSSFGFEAEQAGPFVITLTAGLPVGGGRTLPEDFSFTAVRRGAPEVSIALSGTPWFYDYQTDFGPGFDPAGCLFTYVPSGRVTLLVSFGESVDRAAVETHVKDRVKSAEVVWSSDMVARITVDVPTSYRSPRSSLVTLDLNGMVPVPGKAPLHDLRVWRLVGTTPAHLSVVSGEGSPTRKETRVPLPFAMFPGAVSFLGTVSPGGKGSAAFADAGVHVGEAGDPGTLPWVMPIGARDVREALETSWKFNSMVPSPGQYKWMVWLDDERLLLGSWKEVVAVSASSDGVEAVTLHKGESVSILGLALSPARDMVAVLTYRYRASTSVPLAFDLWIIRPEGAGAEASGQVTGPLALTGLLSESPVLAWLPSGGLGLRTGPWGVQYTVDLSTGEVLPYSLTDPAGRIVDRAVAWTRHGTEADWRENGLVLTAEGRLWSASDQVALSPWLNPLRVAFSPDLSLVAVMGFRTSSAGATEYLVRVFRSSSGEEVDSFPNGSLYGWSDDGRLWVMETD